MSDDKLRVLVIGAHPDDPEWYAGGVIAKYARQGHSVRLVTLTNGDAGHSTLHGEELARRRRAEAAAAGACLGVEVVVLDNHDTMLFPTLEVRADVIRQMREFRPDLVMTHRPWDYHADHRYTAQAVQDAIIPACYVPSVVPELLPLQPMPRVVFMWDEFTRPYPFIADVVVGIDDAVDKKIEALGCHTSQVYDGAAAAPGSTLPADPEGRRAWLRQQEEPWLRVEADLYRERLVELYGEERGRQIRYAEAFELCEYGKSGSEITPMLSDAERRRLFPFYGP